MAPQLLRSSRPAQLQISKLCVEVRRLCIVGIFCLFPSVELSCGISKLCAEVRRLYIVVIFCLIPNDVFCCGFLGGW